MVEVLVEIERGSPYTGGDASRGGMGLLLAKLAHVSAGHGEVPRSLQAMRMAWSRWTTAGPSAGTPPLVELARIVTYADDRGWLKHLKREDCRALVKRLAEELDEAQTALRRQREAAWRQTALMAAEGLVDFLEVRVAKRAGEEGGDDWGVAAPSAMVVQEEARAMLENVVEQIVVLLDAPREVFESPEDSDTLMRPHEGWPAALRRIGASLSSYLHDVAADYEELEASLIPSQTNAEGAPRRTKLFARAQEEPEAE